MWPEPVNCKSFELMRRLALLTTCLAALLAGCAGDPAPAGPAAEDEAPADSRAEKPRKPPLRPVRCPPALSNCRTATGTVLYVEAVDADGDGDAHFVLTSTDSITSPGISVIDVKRSLRPKPLPRSGDRVAAAGPVYRGSYGQRQIEAVAVRVARAR